ncbi:hypothetical protein SOPP22_16040 [Shewanella sp. OPT22]|nr:hypothetical protein SOPP22_16040 [Shewanella sp. OPT22]
MKPICVQTIYVTDLQKSLSFYQQGLEQKIEEQYGDCIVQLQSEGTALILQQIETGTLLTKPQTKLAFQSDDIYADIERLKASGATVLHDQPQSCPVGVYVAFEDIDGIGFELLQFES